MGGLPLAYGWASGGFFYSRTGIMYHGLDNKPGFGIKYDTLFPNGIMPSKEQIKLEIAATDLKTAQLRAVQAYNMLKPSLNFPVRVFLDGSRWVCIFETHQDRLKCPIAYGESPRQACDNFDQLWAGADEFLVDREEEEEKF